MGLDANLRGMTLTFRYRCLYWPMFWVLWLCLGTSLVPCFFRRMGVNMHPPLATLAPGCPRSTFMVVFRWHFLLGLDIGMGGRCLALEVALWAAEAVPREERHPTVLRRKIGATCAEEMARYGRMAEIC